MVQSQTEVYFLPQIYILHYAETFKWSLNFAQQVLNSSVGIPAKYWSESYCSHLINLKSKEDVHFTTTYILNLIYKSF